MGSIWMGGNVADHAVIFDLDGTLIDTIHLHAKAFEEAFAEAGLHIPADRVADLIGKGGDRVVPEVSGGQVQGERAEAIRERHGEIYRQRVGRDGVRVFDGARELLGELRSRGIRTAVASASSADDLRAVLSAAGLPLHDLVDEVVCGADVERSKPAPDAVVAAMGKLGLPPDRCVFVGDTRWDVLSGARAGVAVIGVCTGPHTAERLREAGARRVYADVGALAADLDAALEAAFGAPV